MVNGVVNLELCPAQILTLRYIRQCTLSLRYCPRCSLIRHASQVSTFHFVHPQPSLISGFLWGANITSQRDLVLSSHNSAKSSEALSMRCKANEQITISMIRRFDGSPVFKLDSIGSGGKAPPAISRNESVAQGKYV